MARNFFFVPLMPRRRQGMAPTTPQSVLCMVGVMTTPNALERRTWIRQTWLKDAPLYGVGGHFVLSSDAQVADRDRSDILWVQAPETYPPGPKNAAFLRHCARGSHRFCIKTDDDVVLSPGKLASTLAALYARGDPIVYMGATVWGSFSPSTLSVCGHGLGPKMANHAFLAEDCRSKGAVGPFPFAAGVLEVLSIDLARYIAFESSMSKIVDIARASGAWVKGEDTAIGMLVYESPYATTCMHAGWDLIHDLCFECRDKTQIWRPVTRRSIAVHLKAHQASETTFKAVYQNMSRLCDARCADIAEPMQIYDLRDVCSLYDEMLFHYRPCEYDY